MVCRNPYMAAWRCDNNFFKKSNNLRWLWLRLLPLKPYSLISFPTRRGRSSLPVSCLASLTAGLSRLSPLSSSCPSPATYPLLDLADLLSSSSTLVPSSLSQSCWILQISSHPPLLSYPHLRPSLSGHRLPLLSLLLSSSPFPTTSPLANLAYHISCSSSLVLSYSRLPPPNNRSHIDLIARH